MTPTAVCGCWSVVRADFCHRLAEHRDLAEVLYGAGLPLGLMTADELREAVVKPLPWPGLWWKRELTARLVDDVLDEPGGLPMLSHILLDAVTCEHMRSCQLAEASRWRAADL